MRKSKKIRIFQIIIPVFLLLIFLEIVLLQLKEELSLINLLETSIGLFLIIIYYFLIRYEFKMASKDLREDLRVLTDRFDSIEDDLKEEIKTLATEIKELKRLLKKSKV